MLKTAQVQIDDKTFTLTQLTIGDIRGLEQFIFAAADKGKAGFDIMSSAVRLIHAGVRKAHPDITLEQLESMLTVPDLKPLINAVLELSGLKETAPGESMPAGA